MESIRLSRFTIALLQNLKKIKPKQLPDEYSKLTVSPTVSFLAIAYEKIRNAVEYRESHLIRRAAIDRILKRKLLLNPEGKGEGGNLVRELLWARYFSPDTLGPEDIETVQKIIDQYISSIKTRPKDEEFFFHLLTCSIEEALSPENAQQSSLETFYIFQILKNKVKIEYLTEEEKDTYFFIALEKVFAKSDQPYLRYHLFKLLNKSVADITQEDIIKIDSLIANQQSEKMRRFIISQMPPFKILFEILKKTKENSQQILENRDQLWQTVEAECKTKYDQTSKKLTSLGLRAIAYIFLTKMIFALILEVPLSQYLFNEVNYNAVIINSLFPPLLMFIVIGLTKIPGAQNTKRVYERLTDIIDADQSFETKLAYVAKKAPTRRPTLIFIFTVIYALTFFATFWLLDLILRSLEFNIISQLVFLFFVSLVAFFSYRIRQTAKEYRLVERESFFRPFVDFFTLPFLSVGKFLSSGIAKLNFLTVALDFLIEAPFKLIIEIVEEWINFVRARREEIA